MKKYLFLFLVLFWMTAIFTLSNQPADKSKKLSDGFIARTIGNIYKVCDKNISDEKLENIKDKYTKVVRKMAHFTIYLILGLLVINCLYAFNLTNKYIIWSLLICFLYAVSDEIHQIFVDGRSCEFRDILIDSCGSMLGIFIFSKIMKKKGNKTNNI